MFQHILLATAFDDHSDLAAEMAIDLARSLEARVTLLHVIESIGEEPDDEELEAFYTTLRGKAEENMRALSARFDEQGIEHVGLVRVGVRWETILAEAESGEADLVVLGSRPVLDQENPRLGTTSHQVFFASHKPLLIARR